jgi:hypothetical protein
VGIRILELLSYRDKQMKRKPEVLDILRFVHSVVWPHMFGKAADDLQQANAVSAQLRAASCAAAPVQQLLHWCWTSIMLVTGTCCSQHVTIAVVVRHSCLHHDALVSSDPVHALFLS